MNRKDRLWSLVAAQGECLKRFERLLFGAVQYVPEIWVDCRGNTLKSTRDTRALMRFIEDHDAI